MDLIDTFPSPVRPFYISVISFPSAELPCDILGHQSWDWVGLTYRQDQRIRILFGPSPSCPLATVVILDALEDLE